MRNRINYIGFQKQLKKFAAFSLLDAIKAFPGFDSKRLNEWQAKGYITKLINGWYIFNDVRINENTLFQISNSLRSPSYISLESALSFYNIIPEQAFAVTAVSTVKTQSYSTSKGVFFYKTVKPDLYFGYKVIPQPQGRPILMAELEKALLDLFYLNSNLSNLETIEALRLNSVELQSIDIKKMEKYLELFNSKALNNRYKLLKQFI